MKKRNELRGFIDIHSHILCNIDDGANSIETSVAMLDIAHEEGITAIVATPHYHPVKCMKSESQIKIEYEKIKDIAAQLYPDMKLYLGREVLYTSDVLDELEIGTELTMPGNRYALFEYSSSEQYSYIYNSISNIMHMGIIPIIAHIERYYSLTDDIGKIWELKDMGAVIQVNASSITGGFGKETVKFIKKLLKEELVDVIATDAHSAGKRAPRMYDSMKYVAKKFSRDYAEKIFIQNPDLIIQGKYLEENI